MLGLFRQAATAACFTCFFTSGFISPANAQKSGTLRVMPTNIDVQAPVVSGTFTIGNNGGRPMTVQARVFKWVQQNGESRYIPARGVVASPPMLTLRPQSQTALRVVRTSRAPLMQEESYRVVIDQLPEPALRRTAKNGISFVMRHNMPVFFSPRGDFAPKISWKVAPVKGGYQVTAVNSGGRYIRLSQVKLLARGKVIAREDGLAGYALAGASGSFFVPGRTGGMPDRIQAMDTGNHLIDDVIK